MYKLRCFACDRKLGNNPYLVDTRDDQTVFVGSECFRKIKAAGEKGYLPPPDEFGVTGPRLWIIPTGLTQEQMNELRPSLQKPHTNT